MRIKRNTHVVQKYERLKTTSLEEGFALISAGATDYTKRHIEIDGHRVKVHSTRLQCFLTHGVQCVWPNCPHKGKFFAIERTARQVQYHLNLWSQDEAGTDVLMTMDHILSRGMGGGNDMENLQPMCTFHNNAKSKTESSIVEALWRQERGNVIHGNTLAVKYIGLKKDTKILRTTGIARRTFNFYLNDPGGWTTESFLDIVWKHCGFLCVEVRLVNNSFVHPETGKLAHRYDLFFITGEKLLSTEDVNVLMQQMEIDIRKNLNVELRDTHFPIRHQKLEDYMIA